MTQHPPNKLLSKGGGCDKGGRGVEGGAPQVDSSSAAGKGGFQP